MRKQLISFAQVIKFCKISRSRGFLTPKPPLRTPLAVRRVRCAGGSGVRLNGYGNFAIGLDLKYFHKLHIRKSVIIDSNIQSNSETAHSVAH